jgi:hypothetical protein
MVKTQPAWRTSSAGAETGWEDKERLVVEAVMNEIGKQAAFYRAYLPHDRSLFPTAVALCAVVTIWLFIYLVSIVGPQQEQRTADAGVRAAAVLVSRPISH